MPQLDPNPWFNILLLTWLPLLTIILPLTMARKKNNNPEPPNTQPLLPQKKWGWPWT